MRGGHDIAASLMHFGPFVDRLCTLLNNLHDNLFIENNIKELKVYLSKHNVHVIRIHK